MTFPKDAKEVLVVEQDGLALFVAHFKNGDPNNRVTVKSIKGTENDIVFDVMVRDGKLILQYPLYFKLDKMYTMLKLISTFEKKIVEIGKGIWE